MTASTEAAEPKAPPHGRLARVFWVVCLIYAAIVLVQDVQEFMWNTGRQPGAGDVGATWSWATDMSGFVPIKDVEPQGAYARAGLKAGDRIRFDHAVDGSHRPLAGVTFGVTVKTPQGVSHRVITPLPFKHRPLSTDDWINVFYSGATMLAAAFGGFIIWRGRASPSTLLLGMGLLTYGLISYAPQVDVRGIYTLAYIVGVANLYAIPAFFYRFALQFYADHVGRIRPVENALFWTYAGAQSVAAVLYGALEYNGLALPIVGTSALLGTILSYVGFGLCFFYLIRGWRRSVASSQQRYALMLLATGAIILAQSMDYIVASVSDFGIDPDLFNRVHGVANALLTGVVGAGLFTYSILRHKVFDLGFALNRTLVYGAVSALLLAVFGLIEWAVDHLLAIEGREKNALIDAAIAVGVFLTFHRVRDVVEHTVESLFFRRWQKAEQGLRRFVREAPFFTDNSALLRAGAKALGAYADGTTCAIYLADDGGYTRATGDFDGAPMFVDRDLPVLVSMRADLKPAEIDEGPLKGALAAPMINRNEVIGVALLATKPSGGAWRPDEIELIGWATVQVGLDLHALKIEALTTTADDLKRENATLRSLIPQRA